MIEVYQSPIRFFLKELGNISSGEWFKKSFLVQMAQERYIKIKSTLSANQYVPGVVELRMKFLTLSCLAFLQPHVNGARINCLELEIMDDSAILGYSKTINLVQEWPLWMEDECCKRVVKMKFKFLIDKDQIFELLNSDNRVTDDLYALGVIPQAFLSLDMSLSFTNCRIWPANIKRFFLREVNQVSEFLPFNFRKNRRALHDFIDDIRAVIMTGNYRETAGLGPILNFLSTLVVKGYIRNDSVNFVVDKILEEMALAPRLRFKYLVWNLHCRRRLPMMTDDQLDRLKELIAAEGIPYPYYRSQSLFEVSRRKATYQAEFQINTIILDVDFNRFLLHHSSKDFLKAMDVIGKTPFWQLPSSKVNLKFYSIRYIMDEFLEIYNAKSENVEAAFDYLTELTEQITDRGISQSLFFHTIAFMHCPNKELRDQINHYYDEAIKQNHSMDF